jgi:hypothetical protein
MACKRSNNFTFKPSDELLDSILMANNEQITQIAVAATRLTKFVEKVHHIDIDKEIAESSVWPECPLQKLTKAYLQELLQIESAFPESVHENSEFHSRYVWLSTNEPQSKYKFFGGSPKLNYTPWPWDKRNTDHTGNGKGQQTISPKTPTPKVTCKYSTHVSPK